MLPSRRLLLKPSLGKYLGLVAAYSRRSHSKNLGIFKVVKSNDVIEDVLDTKFGALAANWELLAPKGYRFVMPGSIGPAWHEPGSMVPIDNFHSLNSSLNKVDLEELECTAQECPILLRKGVLELFPQNEVYTLQQLTVVTLRHKQGVHRSRNSEIDTEYYAKTFIWAAQEICIKLKATGYWADFINPFSGKPYLSHFSKSTLYETDERFRCLGFEIRRNGNCKVIQCRDDKNFIGSLFTNAPASTEIIYEILNGD